MPTSDYAGLVTRMAALLIDVILLTILVSLVALGPPAVCEAIFRTVPSWLQTGSQIVGALLPLAYFGLSWWVAGHTLGGMLFGTVVRRPDGQHVGFLRALLRAGVGLLFPYLWLAGMVAVLWDSRRRALHDRLFDTVVLRKGHGI